MDAPAVERLDEQLPFARGRQVPAQLRRDRHRRTNRRELRARVAEPLVHLVQEALVALIEASDVEERRVRRADLTPTLDVALAVEQEVGRAERIRDAEGEARALRQPDLERVERDGEHRRLRPRGLAAVPAGERAELRAEALARPLAGGSEQGLHRRRHRRVRGSRGIEDEGAVVGVAVAVHVPGDDGRVRPARAEAARPVHPDDVAEIVADVVAELVARVEGAARPLHEQRIAGRVLEAAHLLDHVRVHVRGVPGEVRAEARRRDAQRELAALPDQVRPLLAHARELVREACRARCDGAGRGRDARRQGVHGAAPFLEERETLERIEVQVHRTRLVLVERVRDLGGRGEAVVEDRAVPLEVRAHGTLQLIVVGEERDVRGGVGERRPRRPARAELRDGRQVEPVGGPVGDRRRGARAREVLRRAGESRVVDRIAGEARLWRVLEDADAAAHDGARSAHGALEPGDLRRRAVGPREPDARTHEHLVRQRVIAHAEGGLDQRIEGGAIIELVAVEAHAVLQLEVRRLPP